MSNTIHSFIRNKRGHSVGVIAAGVALDGNVYIGWSRCRKGDVFNKEFGLEIAQRRILAKGGNTLVPNSMVEDYNNMLKRASKYFKNQKVWA